MLAESFGRGRSAKKQVAGEGTANQRNAPEIDWNKSFVGLVNSWGWRPLAGCAVLVQVVVSFGQGSWCSLGPCWAISLHRHFVPILGHHGSYAGLCWACWCSCHNIASQTACSFDCANFWLGNFMELCWRYWVKHRWKRWPISGYVGWVEGRSGTPLSKARRAYAQERAGPAGRGRTGGWHLDALLDLQRTFLAGPEAFARLWRSLFGFLLGWAFRVNACQAAQRDYDYVGDGVAEEAGREALLSMNRSPISMFVFWQQVR